MFGRLVPVVLLVLGIVLKWFDWTWPAPAVNGGSFGFLGFRVLGHRSLEDDRIAPAGFAVTGIPSCSDAEFQQESRAPSLQTPMAHC
jgi:hypothetical protein